MFQVFNEIHVLVPNLCCVDRYQNILFLCVKHIFSQDNLKFEKKNYVKSCFGDRRIKHAETEIQIITPFPSLKDDHRENYVSEQLWSARWIIRFT